MRRRGRAVKPIFRGLDFEQRACTRKVRFANERAAAERAAYLTACYPGQERQDVYGCEFCGGWHLATRRSG
ncbi:MAG: hypothetical protein M3T49_03365 [Candidatus Eremiobacteraeota bacterium]|nr:hypothetical protein [Candidatus Eremiobacteraeota bacterium]